MIRRQIKSCDLEREPYLVWNAFVNVAAMEEYAQLDETQRIAHLCFWYDSEVQNGGHLQYFGNRGVGLLNETLAALRVLGASEQREVLQAASRVFLSRDRTRIQTVEKYVETALEDEFGKFDSVYYACTPTVTRLLQDLLGRNQESFVEIV
jgi:hypothetical protein